ncbi:FtsP/CotA-like multicopper oxidase with cupredoxin domain [Phenylobacterium haematophilum]|uniref:FtsP/CotA-like multicopper oxidase with cupredoxin domain n=1 Tax=Phenylobacterium haematophilum TaxID=98513 RepID=A0A840A5I0_9CAUL|nr:copper resistance system multicopper oxidase [Phenylobacterium haematophilum]MBB3892953.1 FtsP/CotA-like multicopper oxidase with cupredoxin domain [Phenylobacterium haematophilum]
MMDDLRRQRSGAAAFPRRRLLQAGAAVTALGALGTKAWALPRAPQPVELTGTEFDLEVTQIAFDPTGRMRFATAVNGLVPGPVLRVREGDAVTIRVANRLKEMTTIPWHGMIVPADMDGVPGISFPGIAPGETFTYRFTVRQSGTFWYHAHTLAEQTGLYGAIIAEPRDVDPIASDRDYPIILSDWTDENPLQVFLNLKKMGGYYNFAQPTVGDFFGDVSRDGVAAAIAKREMWNRARMSPKDFSDVSATTYTYLMNGTPPRENWSAIAKTGETVRLRFIGAGTATYFDVRIPGLKLTVVSTDGQRVEPVTVDEFRIGPGETYDVVVQIPDDRAYTIFAQSMDRTGFTRGTLAAQEGMTAEVPPLDAQPWLDPIDMMGAMAAMSGPHAGHGMTQMAPKARHARTEYGPTTDMRVDYPRSNLDDPGAGLRRNGRRVLTYADLRTVGGALDPRAPDREIELHLTGNMERFIWSLDGLKLNDAKPIHFRQGERLRITFVNDSTMAHPMHLHGMWSELEAPDGTFQVRKHTISVQPAQRVSFAVTADAPGRWAFHCHLLYHMAAGMFREVVVA